MTPTSMVTGTSVVDPIGGNVSGNTVRIPENTVGSIVDGDTGSAGGTAGNSVSTMIGSLDGWASGGELEISNGDALGESGLSVEGTPFAVGALGSGEGKTTDPGPGVESTSGDIVEVTGPAVDMIDAVGSVVGIAGAVIDASTGGIVSAAGSSVGTDGSAVVITTGDAVTCAGWSVFAAIGCTVDGAIGPADVDEPGIAVGDAGRPVESSTGVGVGVPGNTVDGTSGGTVGAGDPTVGGAAGPKVSGADVSLAGGIVGSVGSSVCDMTGP